MIVTCDRCQTRIRIVDPDPSAPTVTVRCTVCQNTFVVNKASVAPEPAWPGAAPAPAPGGFGPAPFGSMPPQPFGPPGMGAAPPPPPLDPFAPRAPSLPAMPAVGGGMAPFGTSPGMPAVGGGTPPAPFGAPLGGGAPSPFGGAPLPPAPFGGAPQAPAPFGGAPPAPSPFGGAPPPPAPFGGAPQAPAPFGGVPPAPSPFGGASQAPAPFGAAPQPPAPFGAPQGGGFPSQAPAPFGMPPPAPMPVRTMTQPMQAFGAQPQPAWSSADPQAVMAPTPSLGPGWPPAQAAPTGGASPGGGLGAFSDTSQAGAPALGGGAGLAWPPVNTAPPGQQPWPSAGTNPGTNPLMMQQPPHLGGPVGPQVGGPASGFDPLPPGGPSAPPAPPAAPGGGPTFGPPGGALGGMEDPLAEFGAPSVSDVAPLPPPPEPRVPDLPLGGGGMSGSGLGGLDLFDAAPMAEAIDAPSARPLFDVDSVGGPGPQVEGNSTRVADIPADLQARLRGGTEDEQLVPPGLAGLPTATRADISPPPKASRAAPPWLGRAVAWGVPLLLLAGVLGAGFTVQHGDRLLAVVAWEAARDWAGLTPREELEPSDVHATVWAMPDGRRLLLVLGTVTNRGSEVAPAVLVRAEFRDLKGAPLKAEQAYAGTLPSEVDLADVVASGNLDERQKDLARRMARRSMEPGAAWPFMVMVADPPEALRRAEVLLTAHRADPPGGGTVVQPMELEDPKPAAAAPAPRVDPPPPSAPPPPPATKGKRRSRGGSPPPPPGPA